MGARLKSLEVPDLGRFPARVAQLPRHEIRARAILAGIALLVLCGTIASLGQGAVRVGWAEVLAILLSKVGVVSGELDSVATSVIWQIRLPRVLLGLGVGAVLGITGAVTQGLFRNPLADPGLLGTSAGAALAVVFLIVLGGRFIPGFPASAGSFALPVAAFCGALVATGLVQVLARVNGGTPVATLLLSGIVLNSFAGAMTALLVFVASDAQLRAVTFWTLGSLGGASWKTLGMALPMTFLSVVLLLPAWRVLNAMLLGECEAGHLGFRVERAKLLLILAVAMGVGAAVSMTGVIGFVGLVVPHVVRLLLGADHRWLLPGSALVGALLLLGADMLARTVAAPAELPIGIVTALLGAPFFLWLLRKSQREATS